MIICSNTRRVVLTRGICALALLAVGATAPAEADQFCGVESLVLEADQTHVGDQYIAARAIRIKGRHEGDLVAVAKKINIDGVLTGDGIFGGESLEIDGQVLDSVRFFGGSATVTGTIDGDLLFVGSELDIPAEGRITGNLLLFAAMATIDGTVEGEVRGGGGTLVIGGNVARDVNLEVDTIRLRSGARIGGDLVYESRKELETEGEPDIGGEILYEKTPEKERKPYLARFGFWWFFSTLSALVVGLVLLVVLRRVVPAVVRPVGQEVLLVLLIGFGTFLIVPATAILSMVLVISIPLALMTLTVFAIVLYLAKLPVALWVGRRLIGLASRSEPSPFLALALGTLILYVLFTVPYLGVLIWLGTAWLGLGAILLALRTHLQAQRGVSRG